MTKQWAKKKKKWDRISPRLTHCFPFSIPSCEYEFEYLNVARIIFPHYKLLEITFSEKKQKHFCHCIQGNVS